MSKTQLAATCAPTRICRAMVLRWRWRAICEAGMRPKKSAATNMTATVKSSTRQSGVALTHFGASNLVECDLHHCAAQR